MSGIGQSLKEKMLEKPRAGWQKRGLVVLAFLAAFEIIVFLVK